MRCVLSALVLLSVIPGVSNAQAPRSLPTSPWYEVSVAQGSDLRAIKVHFSKAQKTDTNRPADASWARFAWSPNQRLRISVPRGTFLGGARVLPTSAGATLAETGGALTIELPSPGTYAVTVPDLKAHRLFLFADAVVPPPPPDDHNTLRFGPGTHDLGETFIEPKPGQTVYLDEGAVVFGRIRIRNAPGVSLRGPGILSGGHLPPNPPDTYTVPHLIEADTDSPGIVIDGPTLIESPHYNVLLRGENCVVRNTRMIGWWYGTDGIGIGPNGRIEDCFFQVNDDSIKIYNSGLVVSRCVIWQLENGAAFQFSWNLNGDSRGFRVTDCDIIGVDHHQEANNRGVFTAIHGGKGRLSDYLFEDIRVENARFRLLLLTIKKTSWSKAKEWGSIRNVHFRRLHADGPFARPSVISSDHPDGRFEQIVFEDLRIGDQTMTSAPSANLQIDPALADQVHFIPSP
jgi:hypothetical protein